jgi:hypothetical protein
MFMIGQSEKMLLTLLVSLCIVFSLLISSLVFQDSVLSSDEWSYLIQAHIFSHGKLAVPSPKHRESFDFVHIVNNGWYYSKYPPGWPFLLAIGVWLGMPRVVNSLLGAGTLLLLYAIGKKLYTPRIALLASLFAVASPYFLFNTASYFSHTASLFFVTLLLFLLMCGWEERRWSYFLLAGLSGSASFLVRPFDQCAVLVPIGIFLIVSRMRKQLATHHIASFALGQLSGVLLFLVYNAFQNGHPLVTGYHVADSWMDRWIGPELWMMWAYDVHYLVKLLTWSFLGIPLLALVALVSTGPEATKRWERCLASVLFAIMTAHALVAFPEGPGYGPRYYYSGFLALPLLGSRGFVLLFGRSTNKLLIPVLVGTALLEVGIVIPHHGRWAYDVICEQNDFERQVNRLNAGPALVFLALDHEANLNRTRNTIDFRGPIVYAHHRGAASDQVLMEAYPGRRYFVYEYDQNRKQGVLREIRREREAD